MFSDALNQTFETLEILPQEVGTEAVGQIKGNTQQNQAQDHQNQSFTGDPNDPEYQKYLQDLYGTSGLTSDQLKQKEEQENKIKKNAYQQIQQDIAEYRAKKSQEISKEEIGLQQGTKAARTQEEKQELWQEEQKKAEEKRKKEEEIIDPGSQQSRSGEQGKIMG